MIAARPIELLSPAKNLTCGKEAVLHGADAVYIGAPKFSARAAAGNSVDEIRHLCDFAHPFNVRIYVAINTILKDSELLETERLIYQLYRAGVDALIIQDMGITQLDLPPIALHASTQTDNTSVEKIRFLYEAGFTRVVLARELTLDEMKSIHKQIPVELEAFVHGSLCVSYSGRCYLSAAMNGRSANRGECAQLCRLPYTLVDDRGEIIVNGKHLLSLKDLNRANELEAMMQAGISSFKIEGRLKDVSYVKNITAFYRKKMDVIFMQNPAYYRASAGDSSHTFRPQPEKSFNRKFTPYYLHGRVPDTTSFDTPKSLGEPIGVVKETNYQWFTLETKKAIRNGDGFIFENSNGVWEGVRANRVEGNRVYLLKKAFIRTQTIVYRNYDKAFEDTLAKCSAGRKLAVKFELRDTHFGIMLSVTDETNSRATVTRATTKELADKDQQENIRMQLSKLGNTPFRANEISVNLCQMWFIPSSILTEMRRSLIEALLLVKRIRYRQPKAKHINPDAIFPAQYLDYTANVSNAKAEAFYHSHGVDSIEKAYELQPKQQATLMFTKHCLRYSMGWCPLHHNRQSPYKEPFYLVYQRTKLRLHFDCKACQMTIVAVVE